MSHSNSKGNRINRPPKVVFISKSSARFMGWLSSDGMGVCGKCSVSSTPNRVLPWKASDAFLLVRPRSGIYEKEG